MKKNITKIIRIALYLSLFSIGILFGMFFQQQLFIKGLVDFADNLEGVTINIDLNETLLMEQATKNVKELVWDMRKQNCTRTEKNYCAIECYENNILIPCQNFTGDEHFCKEGICEMNGGCPTYFERMNNKTIEDCINEI